MPFMDRVGTAHHLYCLQPAAVGGAISPDFRGFAKGGTPPFASAHSQPQTTRLSTTPSSCQTITYCRFKNAPKTRKDPNAFRPPFFNLSHRLRLSLNPHSRRRRSRPTNHAQNQGPLPRRQRPPSTPPAPPRCPLNFFPPRNRLHLHRPPRRPHS